MHVRIIIRANYSKDLSQSRRKQQKCTSNERKKGAIFVESAVDAIAFSGTELKTSITKEILNEMSLRHFFPFLRDFSSSLYFDDFNRAY